MEPGLWFGWCVYCSCAVRLSCWGVWGGGSDADTRGLLSGSRGRDRECCFQGHLHRKPTFGPWK